MRPGHLQDTLSRGAGRAARAIGVWCEAYRPIGTGDPLKQSNLFLRLPASFAPPNVKWHKPVAYGQALWHGIFDSAYTRPGDYILRPESRPGANDGGIWFIAAQEPLLPVLCVHATRIVSLVRAAPPAAPGTNSYGGVVAGNTVPLISLWPASVLAAGSGGETAGLPADVPPGAWWVLLPPTPGVTLRNGDLLADDIGRSAVVASSELTDLGWRLIVRQSTT
jgi:hypothetical protein